MTRKINLDSKKHEMLIKKLQLLKEKKELFESIPDAIPQENEEMLRDDIKEIIKKFHTNNNLSKIMALLTLVLREGILSSINEIEEYESFLIEMEILDIEWKTVKIPTNLVAFVKELLAKLNALIIQEK